MSPNDSSRARSSPDAGRFGDLGRLPDPVEVALQLREYRGRAHEAHDDANDRGDGARGWRSHFLAALNGGVAVVSDQAAELRDDVTASRVGAEDGTRYGDHQQEQRRQREEGK